MMINDQIPINIQPILVNNFKIKFENYAIESWEVESVTFPSIQYKEEKYFFFWKRKRKVFSDLKVCFRIYHNVISFFKEFNNMVDDPNIKAYIEFLDPTGVTTLKYQIDIKKLKNDQGFNHLNYLDNKILVKPVSFEVVNIKIINNFS